MPVLEFEQAINQELEENPFLEEDVGDDDEAFLDTLENNDAPAPDQSKNDYSYDYDNDDANLTNDDNYSDYTSTQENTFDDAPFNNYDTMWDDDEGYSPKKSDDEDYNFEPYQINVGPSLTEDLLNQINTLELTTQERFVANFIIGSIDNDGYLPISDSEIIDEINTTIAKQNGQIQHELYIKEMTETDVLKKYSLSSKSADTLINAANKYPEIAKLDSDVRRVVHQYADETHTILSPINSEFFEHILSIVQSLEPPGIASRNLQECLVAQLKAIKDKNEEQSLALLILTNAFNDFSQKHFKELKKRFNVTDDQLRDCLCEIKKLNPKPGGDDYNYQLNTVVPDFLVRYNEDINDFEILLNNSTVPALRVNRTYERMREEAKGNKKYNKDTKSWIKEKYENAKFFINAVKQRNISMLSIMTAIVHRQREFFMNDIYSIKPMVYKEIAEDTGLDISTVCRIVNDKYVMTRTGTYELKFFFSEKLSKGEIVENTKKGRGRSRTNEEDSSIEVVSTTIIKERLKELIAAESKKKPYSDEKLCQIFKDEYDVNIARRTIAKYREALKIPVARLRKEL